MQREKDSRAEPKSAISLSLQNQHPYRRCELGPGRSFIVSLQSLNAEELSYFPSPCLWEERAKPRL